MSTRYLAKLFGTAAALGFGLCLASMASAATCVSGISQGSCSCSTTLSNATVNGDMTVPAGATCTTTKVTVTHDTTVGKGSTLDGKGGGNSFGHDLHAQNPKVINLSNSTVAHDLQSQGSGDIDLYPMNSIGHDLHIQQANSICTGGQDKVDHDEHVEGTTGFIMAGSKCDNDGFTKGENALCNTKIGHDLQLNNNIGAFGVGSFSAACSVGLSIGHDAQVNGNGIVTFDNNDIEHDLGCNGNTSVSTTSGNDVDHNENGQCASFTNVEGAGDTD